MERLKCEHQRDERMRQQLRENSTELRELEAKLRAGYMNKERAAQLAEKDTMKVLENEREAEIAAMMKLENEKAKELEQEKEIKRWERSMLYQEQLERQLEEQVHMCTVYTNLCSTMYVYCIPARTYVYTGYVQL